MKILVTGASGFIGSHLVGRLQKAGDTLFVATRREVGGLSGKDIKRIAVGEIDGNTVWDDILRDIDVVIHLAGRVHVMHDYCSNPLAEYRKVNLCGTTNLANACAQQGVKRFIFLSTIKVNGEFTLPGCKFNEIDLPNPSDPYAISKYEAEERLLKLSISSNMEIVIIRPPLVYGPDVKANFLLLMKLCSLSLPIPLGRINNSRSFISIDNLVDFVHVCTVHPAAKNEIFLVSDGEDLSTTQLIEKISQSIGKTAKLFYIPIPILRCIARLFGRSDIFDRLTNSMRLDIQKSRKLLNWEPKISASEGLYLLGLAYLRKSRNS
jgi:nucleoside-diphosphate-sugar epimerase